MPIKARTPDGRKNKEYSHQWREINLEKARECSRKSSAKYRKNRPDKVRQQTKSWIDKNKDRMFAISTINHHKRRGHEIKITIPEIAKLYNETKVCFYCGNPMVKNAGVSGDASPTLDRINNGPEVSLSNVRIICKKCNYTKRNRTHEQFIDYCRNVANLSKRTVTREWIEQFVEGSLCKAMDSHEAADAVQCFLLAELGIEISDKGDVPVFNEEGNSNEEKQSRKIREGPHEDADDIGEK